MLMPHKLGVFKLEIKMKRKKFTLFMHRVHIKDQKTALPRPKLVDTKEQPTVTIAMLLIKVAKKGFIPYRKTSAGEYIRPPKLPIYHDT